MEAYFIKYEDIFKRTNFLNACKVIEVINFIILFDLSNNKILLQSKFNDQLCIGH